MFLAAARNSGTKLIQKIITLRSTRDHLYREQTSLTKRIARVVQRDPLGEASIDLQTELDMIAVNINGIKRQLDDSQRLLADEGEAGLAKLKRLKKSKFIEALVNAIATKSRIRSLLQFRKLESIRLSDAIGMLVLNSVILIFV